MAKVLTKSQIIQTIADAHKDKLVRKDVARLLESLTAVGHKELKKNGIFVLPGFGVCGICGILFMLAGLGLVTLERVPTNAS